MITIGVFEQLNIFSRGHTVGTDFIERRNQSIHSSVFVTNVHTCLELACQLLDEKHFKPYPLRLLGIFNRNINDL